jgi:hypothetical protein
MEKICKNCNHWKNQNYPSVIATANEEEVGACFKLQRSLVIIKEVVVEHHMRQPMRIVFSWPTEALYTVESFSCKDYTDKTIQRSKRTT